MRPTLARDQDIFFAAVALLCGGILVFQSWRLDPILQFAQFLSAGSAIWFAVEAIRLRAIATEQAKRSTPVVDEERPVSRVYRAELDDWTALDEPRNVTRRIRGSRETYANEPEGYGEEARRRPASRSSSDRSDRYGSSSSDRPRRPRSSRPSDLPPDRTQNQPSWDEDLGNRSTRSSSASRPSVRDENAPTRRRPGRSSQDASSRRREYASDTADYVDYQPINDDNSARDEWQ